MLLTMEGMRWWICLDIIRRYPQFRELEKINEATFSKIKLYQINVYTINHVGTFYT
jgi:hypothetical protein